MITTYQVGRSLSKAIFCIIFSRFLVAETRVFSKYVCRSMVAMMDDQQMGRMGLSDFLLLLNNIAKWKVSEIGPVS